MTSPLPPKKVNWFLNKFFTSIYANMWALYATFCKFGSIRGRSFIMSYRLGVGGGKQKYDTLWQGLGRGMTNHDVWQWQGGIGLKDLDIMVKFRHETHKKGEVLAWKCKNSTILLWIWINSDWFHHSKLSNYSSTRLKLCLKNIRLMKKHIHLSRHTCGG